MIVTHLGHTILDGSLASINADLAMIIKEVYQATKEKLGDEKAREFIHEAGEKAFRAIDRPEEEQAELSEIAKMLADLFGEEEEIEK